MHHDYLRRPPPGLWPALAMDCKSLSRRSGHEDAGTVGLIRSAWTVDVAPSSCVSAQLRPPAMSGWPIWHEPSSGHPQFLDVLAHQFQPMRTSSLSRQKSFQSSHLSWACGRLLQPPTPASTATSPMWTLRPRSRAQPTSSSHAFRSFAGYPLASPRQLHWAGSVCRRSNGLRWQDCPMGRKGCPTGRRCPNRLDRPGFCRDGPRRNPCLRQGLCSGWPDQF
jgi:hypothetical protein